MSRIALIDPEGTTGERRALLALNLFTNYVNLAFAVPVDFPSVRLSRAASMAADQPR